MSTIRSKLSYQNAMIALTPDMGGDAVIFFHPIGGGIIPYCNLLPEISASYSCYAMQAFKLSGIELVVSSLHTLAEIYSRLILQHLVERQCLLVGWSFGGILAFEVARILAQRGMHPKKLIMIDACFSFPGHIHHYVDSQDFSKQGLLGLFCKDLLQIFPFNDLDLKEIFSITKLFQVLHQMQHPMALLGHENLENMWRVFQGNVEALYHYVPQQYSATVHHITAKQSVNSIVLDRNLWKGLTDEKSEFFDLECNHYEIMKNVETKRLIANILG